jgi:hypothetical protein
LGVSINRARQVVPKRLNVLLIVHLLLTHAALSQDYCCVGGKAIVKHHGQQCQWLLATRKEQVMTKRAISVWLAVLTMSVLSSSALAKEQVPIKGEFATQFQIIGVEFPIWPIPAPRVTLMVQGEGQASHLGLTACLSDHEVVDFSLGGKLTGTLTLTAANGDTLVGEMDAMAVADYENDMVLFEGTLTFTGGTGRFKDATGQASLGGGATPIAGPTGDGWFSFQGTVSSPGASKK